MALLEVKDLEVNYGLIKAIKGVSFEVNEGEIVALIGANGAGKTTVMHAVNGLLQKANGSVSFLGKDVTNVPAHNMVYLGMAQVPEGRRIFQELTVYENLQMGFYSAKNKADFDKLLEEVYENFPILKERKNQIAGTLSGGEQQMLAMSRALMSRPKLLLLDEPSMGTREHVVVCGIDEVIALIRTCAHNPETITIHALHDGDLVAPCGTSSST